MQPFGVKGEDSGGREKGGVKKKKKLKQKNPEMVELHLQMAQRQSDRSMASLDEVIVKGG